MAHVKIHMVAQENNIYNLPFLCTFMTLPRFIGAKRTSFKITPLKYFHKSARAFTRPFTAILT